VREPVQHSWQSTRRHVDVFWLMILAALWGCSYLFIKVAVSEVPALTLVAARLVLGAAVLWVLVRISGQSMPRRRSLWATYAAMGLLNGAIPYSLIFWGEQYISSGLAALLQATMPLFTVILAHFLADEERMSLRKAMGVVAGFVGVSLLMLADLRRGLHANVLGQAAIVASSVSYATATIVARNHLRGQPALISTAGQLTMGAVFILPLSLLVDRPFHLSPSLAAVGSWLGLTLLGTVVAYTIYYALVERTNATFVSTVTYIIPVNGLILGALVLGEPLTWTLLASLGLILVGVLLVRS
jgi:drug/metabolite transporter (DMT)-like permease